MNNDTKARLGGAGFIAIACLLVKIAVLDVLANARSGAGHVSTSMKGVIMIPALFAVGVLLVLMGAPQGTPGPFASHFVDGHGPTSRLRPLGWVVVCVFIALGLGLYAWLQNQLSALGYR